MGERRISGLRRDVAGPFATYSENGNAVVSPSQISVFRTCSQRWHYSFKGGHASAQTVPQAVGTVCHAVIEECLRDIQRGATPDVAGLAKYTQDAWSEYLRLNEGKLDGSARASHEWQASDGVVRAIGWVLGHGLMPVAVEKEVTWLPPSAPAHVTGRTDWIARTPQGRTLILDWKFPRRSPMEIGPNRVAPELGPVNCRLPDAYRLACTAYSRGAESVGTRIDAVGTVSVVYRPTRHHDAPIRVSLAPNVPALSSLAERQVLEVLNRINSGDIRPEPEQAGEACHPERCAFYEICPGVKSRREAAA